MSRSLTRRQFAATLLTVPLAAGLAATGPGAAAQPGPGSPPRPVANPLADMLAVTPNFESSTVLAYYADIALQLEAVGVDVVEGPDDPRVREWAGATRSLLVAPALSQRALDPTWREVFGFDIFQADQTLFLGEPPTTMTLLRGRFDLEEIRTALEASGYEAVDLGGHEGYSLFPDPEIDPANPVTRLALSSMNNALFLPDGSIAFSPYLRILEQIPPILAGDEPSLAARVDVAAVLDAMSEPVASALLVNGLALAGITDPAIVTLDPTEAAAALETAVAREGEMPPILFALLGITPGGPMQWPGSDATPPPDPEIPNAEMKIAVLTASEEAAQSVIDVASERLANETSQSTGRPLTDYFASWEGSVAADQPVALLTLQFAGANTSIWMDMLFRRDLGFLAW